jgi:hypothetical protein
MILKDFKEMVNRVLFCAKSGFLYGSGGGEIILKKEDGNLVLTIKNHLCYFRLGFVRLYVEEDDFPDFSAKLGDTEVKCHKESPIFSFLENTEAQDAETLSISKSCIWSDYSGFAFVSPFGEYILRFSFGSTTVDVKKYDSGLSEYAKHYFENDGLSITLPCSFSVSRQAFIDTLGMVSSIVPCQFSSLLHIDLFPGKLVLRTFDFEDSAQAELPCDYSGEETAFTFELKLFRETLEHIDTDSVSIRFGLRNIDVAIMPVHPAGETAIRLDYFFILAQKIRWGWYK